MIDLDAHYSDKTNGHCIILGNSGVGKSYTAYMLLDNFHSLYPTVFNDVLKGEPYLTHLFTCDLENANFNSVNEIVLEWVSEYYPENDCIVQTVQKESCIESRVFRLKESEE